MKINNGNNNITIIVGLFKKAKTAIKDINFKFFFLEPNMIDIR